MYKKWGSKIININIKEALALRKKGFLHFFSYSKEIFEDKSKNQMERTATYCTDLGKFADHVFGSI